jgi:hypothetical protein
VAPDDGTPRPAPGLLAPQEIRIWAAGFLVVALLLALTGFASDDPDSALHAALSARLAEGPVSHWVVPEWWGNWDSEGLYREHPIGVLFLPTLLASIGVPAVPASYIVGIAAGLAALLLLGHLVSRLGTAADGRAAMVLLQLMPVAFLFRIRANHEYPMLVCLLLTVVGLEGVQRSWRWAALVAAALSAALLIKGVFVVIVLAGRGAEVGHVRRRQIGVDENSDREAPVRRPPELFGEDHRRHSPQPETAIFLGYSQPEVPKLAHRVEHVSGDGAVPLPLLGHRNYLVFNIFPDTQPDRVEVFVYVYRLHSLSWEASHALPARLLYPSP